MRSVSLGYLGLVVGAAVFAAGCGPGGPPNLEGFGEAGETEGDPSGDGDPTVDPTGDGDGDGDGDPGDGDGGPTECIDADLGSQSQVFYSAFVDDTLANDHPGTCGPTPGPDFSMTWRAPSNGVYWAELYPENPAWLTILAGDCSGELLDCNAFEWPVTLPFQATAGQVYTFVVDGEGPVGYFDFSLYPEQISNACPEGGELFEVPATVFGSSWGASNDFQSWCGGEEASDISYIFFPPYNGVYEIDTFGSNYDTVVHVLDSYCSGDIVDCNDDAVELQSQVFVDLIAGQPYTIVVDGYGGSSGDYQLNIAYTEELGLCSNIQILEPVAPTGVAWWGEENGNDVYAQCSFLSRERRFLWYAPADGSYRARFEGAPSNALSVLLGGCNGDPAICDIEPPDGVLFDAVAGQEIVFVSEYEPFPGDLFLTVEPVGTGGPGCGDPLPEGVPTNAAGTTQGGGNQYTGSCAVGPAQEVEYWWTAPETGSYLISLEGSGYDTLLYVRDGGCDGVELGCNDDTQVGQQLFLWSSLQLDLVAGQTISIFVDGYSGNGNYELAITSL